MQPVNRVIQTILLAAGILVAGGCAVTPSINPVSIVQVNQPLEIPNRKARVYIQNGDVTAKRDLDPWNIYCSVLMQNVHTAGEPKLTVSPGQFEIIKVREYDEHQYFPGNFVASLLEWHNIPPIVIFTVEMRLKSPEQPGVRALICAKQVESYGRHYPTLAEIKTALGNAIEIKTP
ncbi:MAG: hypothetical protein IIB69_13790 [Proteobacteria bacterium]|nr:hypothetical protein [Pseudomonadota bacterium]